MKNQSRINNGVGINKIIPIHTIVTLDSNTAKFWCIEIMYATFKPVKKVKTKTQTQKPKYPNKTLVENEGVLVKSYCSQ